MTRLVSLHQYCLVLGAAVGNGKDANTSVKPSDRKADEDGGDAATPANRKGDAASKEEVVLVVVPSVLRVFVLVVYYG